MQDDRIERLLEGYRLPEVSPALDRRVLRESAAIFERASTRATVETIARDLLQRLGFGYVAWAFDFVTTNDAEYSVEFI